MEIFILIVLIVSAAIFINLKTSNSRVERNIRKKNTYSYTSKPLLMTKTEAVFFSRIESAVSERYYVFPQVHLSAILDHKVSKQNWSYAFKHINGKSVDYVLCDKDTLEPVYAIELDDYTHDRKERVERDIEVERIFTQAGLPLVRFKNYNLSNDEIIQALVDAKSNVSA